MHDAVVSRRSKSRETVIRDLLTIYMIIDGPSLVSVISLRH